MTAGTLVYHIERQIAIHTQRQTIESPVGLTCWAQKKYNTVSEYMNVFARVNRKTNITKQRAIRKLCLEWFRKEPNNANIMKVKITNKTKQIMMGT